ncbi:MAG: CYTH domain-containing protein [Spirochaetaceae bacterium]|jgi:adenylate cyclase class 2|nr:CYTH domain-containing protein [Spirochaetaceae bacterium]
MAIEVELKAWVDDVPKTEAALDEFTGYIYAYTKEDVYWRMDGKEVRVRQECRVSNSGVETSRTLVTFKTKEVRDGIEVNEEHEFCVSAAEASGAANSKTEFEEFLKRTGFVPVLSKIKRGKCRQTNAGGYNVLIELSFVEQLGYFLELEIMLETESAAAVEAARAALLNLLERAGIPASRIESRYYSEMLKQPI